MTMDLQQALLDHVRRVQATNIDELNIALLQSGAMLGSQQPDFEAALVSMLDRRLLFLDERGFVCATSPIPSINVYHILLICQKLEKERQWFAFYACISALDDMSYLANELLSAEILRVRERTEEGNKVNYPDADQVCCMKSYQQGLTTLCKSFLFIFRAFMDQYLALIFQFNFIISDLDTKGKRASPSKDITDFFFALKQGRLDAMDGPLVELLKLLFDQIMLMRYIRNNLKKGAVTTYRIESYPSQKKFDIRAHVRTTHTDDKAVDLILSQRTINAKDVMGFSVPSDLEITARSAHRLLVALVESLERRVTFDSADQRLTLGHSVIQRAGSFWFNIG